MTAITDRWVAPGPQPNGLQAAEDGLWLIDQRDNHLYKLAYEDGSVIARLPTETDRSSGVTEGGGHVWVASTYNARIYKLDGDGATVDHYDTPGKGVVGFGEPGTDARDRGPRARVAGRRDYVGCRASCKEALPGRRSHDARSFARFPRPAYVPTAYS